MERTTIHERAGDMVLADSRQALDEFEGSSRGVVPTCATQGPRGVPSVAAIDAMVPCTGRVGLETCRAPGNFTAGAIADVTAANTLLPVHTTLEMAPARQAATVRAPAHGDPTSALSNVATADTTLDDIDNDQTFRDRSFNTRFRTGSDERKGSARLAARSIDTSLGGHAAEVARKAVGVELETGGSGIGAQTTLSGLPAESDAMKKFRFKMGRALGLALECRDVPRVYRCLMQIRRVVEARDHQAAIPVVTTRR